MSYKVIPYVANITNKGKANDIAVGVENRITAMVAEGWEFVQIQELTTYQAGSSGCFGFGATPGRMVSVSVLIFKQ